MESRKEITEEQAYQRLAALCARSEHCRHEMLEKMRQWGLDEQTRDHVMERLARERYVDDERFARAFAGDKTRYNKWGRRKVEQALRLKHIDENIVRQVLSETDTAAYARILQPLLRQKRQSIKAASAYERNMKLVKFALGRGFTMDVIRQCMEVEDENEYLDQDL